MTSLNPSGQLCVVVVYCTVKKVKENYKKKKPKPVCWEAETARGSIAFYRFVDILHFQRTNVRSFQVGTN